MSIIWCRLHIPFFSAEEMAFWIIYRFEIRNDATWRPKYYRIPLTVDPSERVRNFINYAERGLVMRLPLFSIHECDDEDYGARIRMEESTGSIHDEYYNYKTMFMVGRGRSGLVHLDPDKTWKEQGVQNEDCVYRFKRGTFRPAEAA